MNELTNKQKKQHENYIPFGINARGIILLDFLKDNVVAQPCLFSTLDKQRICVNTQLKSSKKQLK